MIQPAAAVLVVMVEHVTIYNQQTKVIDVNVLMDSPDNNAKQVSAYEQQKLPKRRKMYIDELLWNIFSWQNNH